MRTLRQWQSLTFLYWQVGSIGMDAGACGYAEVAELERASRGGLLLRTLEMVKSVPG